MQIHILVHNMLVHITTLLFGTSAIHARNVLVLMKLCAADLVCLASCNKVMDAFLGHPFAYNVALGWDIPR